MLNVERIKIMTKLTSYEERAGRSALTITKYFKKDYVILHMITTAITTTFAYFLLVGMWLFYEFEDLVESIDTINLWQLGFWALLAYVVFLVIFLVIAFFVYSSKYKKAKASMTEYVEGLKELERFYQEEEKTKAGFTAPVGGKLKYDDFTGV